MFKAKSNGNSKNLCLYRFKLSDYDGKGDTRLLWEGATISTSGEQMVEILGIAGAWFNTCKEVSGGGVWTETPDTLEVGYIGGTGLPTAKAAPWVLIT